MTPPVQKPTNKPRPFLLQVDSGAQEEPPNRYFGTLDAALKAAAEYDDRFQPFVWIMELLPGGRTTVHVKDGKPQVRGGELASGEAAVVAAGSSSASRPGELR